MEKKGMLAIIIATLVWGSVGLNVRLLHQQGLEPFTINFFNMLIGSVFIYLYAIYKGKKVTLHYSKNTPKHLILQGIFFGLTVILLFFSFINTSIANASFIQQTMPLWVMLLSVFFLKEKITVTKIFALIIAFIGILLLFQITITSASLKGDFLALLSSFAFSGMVLNGRKLKNISEYTSTFFQLSIACLMMFPLMLFNFRHNSLDNIWITILLFLFLGIVNTGLTQRLFLFGLRFVEASKTSLLNLIEPVSATVFAFVFLSEKVTLYSFLGMCFVLTAAVIIILSAGIKNRITSDKEAIS